MVKLRFPIVSAVARFALFAETPLVGVVFAVAGKARAWRVLVAVICVASVAFRVCMFPQQGEPRFVMVELDILPRLVVVAAIAFFAQTPFVFVVLAVASEAR